MTPEESLVIPFPEELCVVIAVLFFSVMGVFSQGR